ncbi:hypothetical protein Daus18300_013574 [Diaporthe australafricana]|uniref:Uncharacterized protein n=1 Tax=Diaporthe australafricana TaxID=127596 RepID=A0ABR3VYJ4_9PEZI
MYATQSQVSPAVYVPQQLGHPATTADPLEPFRPRAFEFSLSINRIETLSDFADVVHAESPNIRVFSLKELELTDAQMQEASLDNDGTYIARQSGWLRLELGVSGYRGAKFLRRTDGQRVAAALLKLPLSPYGYLMSSERSLCRAMLCEAAHALPQLLTRTMWSVDDGPFALLESAVRENLRVAMADFYQLSQPAKPTRLYFEALFKLDTALDAAITGPATASTEQEELIALSMGCVMVTSPEFRSLVAQSARLLVQGFDGKMSMDMTGGQVKVPTVLNFIAEFPVDLDDIAPHVDAASRSGTVEIPLAKFMLICQRAALRSAMLDSALDSIPLFEAVARLQNVVHIA